MRIVDRELDQLLNGVLRGEATPWPRRPGEDYARRLLERAAYHGVEALLHQRLRTAAAAPDWPATALEPLRQRAFAQAGVAALQQAELRRVLAHLHQRGLRPLLMKGAALAHSHYAYPHLRPRGDTDALVPRDSVAPLQAALEELGYKRNLSIAGELVMYQLCLERRDSDAGLTFVFDVHWRISNPQLFAAVMNYEELNTSAVALDPLGPQARALGPAHALTLACVHRVAHHANSDRLIWLYDIHLLAGSMDAVELETFAKFALERRVAAVCAAGLRHACDALHTALPAGFLDKLDARRSGNGPEASASFLRPGRRRLHALAADLATLPSAGQRLKLLREHALPSADYMLARYRSRTRVLLPWLYVRRLAGGLVKLLRSAPGANGRRP